MINKLKNRINLASLLVLLVTSCCLVALINYFQKQHALENAEEKSLILLQHNLAIHTYYNKHLKPRLFALTDQIRDTAYFDPVWMSSTYAVRDIDRLYQQLAKDEYYYKEAAINARSPENEADEFERAFIDRLKQEPGLEKLSGVRILEDKPFFFTLIRGESMEKNCLRCHSTPDKAPAGMVAQYGSSRSFNRSDGELVSAISIRIPLSEAYRAANSFSMKLSLILLGILLLTYYLQNRIIKRLVLSPLEQFRSRADAIANNPELIGAEITGNYALEMNEIAESFNKMSVRLKSFVENLEQTVHERTTQLAQSEERFRHIAESMADWIWEVDANGRYTYCSPTVTWVLGYLPEEMQGKTPFEFMTPEDREKVKATFDELCARHAKIQNLVNWNITKDGRRICISTSGVPVFNETGTFLGYRGVDTDTTKLLQLEEQLRQSQKLESIGRLAGGVAHDFNNKLTVILGNAELATMELATRGVSENDSTCTYLQQIIQAANHSRDITAQLLAFSRQQIRSPRPLDLNTSIANSLASLSVLIGKTVQIAFTPGENVWMVNMDPVQVDQIIMNLAINASEAMPGGGYLTITTENASVDETTAASNKDAAAGDYLLLTIRDTGEGMDEKILSHIFEPFFTTKDVGKGTGLGLATVYGIVVQNKGFTYVSSQLGHGTVFRIYLPRYVES